MNTKINMKILIAALLIAGPALAADPRGEDKEPFVPKTSSAADCIKDRPNVREIVRLVFGASENVLEFSNNMKALIEFTCVPCPGELV